MSSKEKRGQVMKGQPCRTSLAFSIRRLAFGSQVLQMEKGKVTGW